MIIVSDTTPLSELAKVGQVALLQTTASFLISHEAMNPFSGNKALAQVASASVSAGTGSEL